MMSSITAFRSFNVANPQHLGWLKRKLRNRDRYERRMRKQASEPRSASFRLPRHLQSRRPAVSRFTSDSSWQEYSHAYSHVTIPQDLVSAILAWAYSPPRGGFRR